MIIVRSQYFENILDVNSVHLLWKVKSSKCEEYLDKCIKLDMDIAQPAWEKVDGKWIIKKPPEEMWESVKG